MVMTPKVYNHHDQMILNRNDISRKLDFINTWVPDAIRAGYDVIFFSGASEHEYYHEASRTLYLNVDDRYEPVLGDGTTTPLSRCLVKIQAGFKWALANRDFDWVYFCDDDIFINVPEFSKLDSSMDYRSSQDWGGGGHFFSRKAAQVLVDYENTSWRLADQCIGNLMWANQDLVQNRFTPQSHPWYVPGELYATVHYATGKRAHHLYHMFKNFQINGFTNRKIIFGSPVSIWAHNEIMSYESPDRNTARWYDFTTDPNGWEYIGGYPRGDVGLHHFKEFWPFAENGTKYFVINPYLFFPDFANNQDLYKADFNFLVEKCLFSLINKNNLLLCTEKEESIQGWQLDNSVKETLQLNFETLNDYNFYIKK